MSLKGNIMSKVPSLESAKLYREVHAKRLQLTSAGIFAVTSDTVGGPMTIGKRENDLDDLKKTDEESDPRR